MSTTSEFFLNIVSGGVVGLVASFVASKFFLKHNNSVHRPVIEMSDKVIKSARADGTPTLMIKVLNKTDKDIADIIFEVEGVENQAPLGSIPLLNLTRLGRRELLFIKEFDENDNTAHYAHRVNLFQEGEDIIAGSQNYETIRVSIRASCPYYGTSTVLSTDYNVRQDILSTNHSFNTGNSLSISSH